MVDDKKKGSIDGDLISVPMCPSALKIYKIIGNKNYQVRYYDDPTKKLHRKSTGTDIKEEAIKFAQDYFENDIKKICKIDLPKSTDKKQPLKEKYRPQILRDCILSEGYRNIFTRWIENGQNAHFIFYGSAGTGKTSTAIALANEVSPDNKVFINAGQEKSIDDMEKIIQGMTTKSLFDENKKIIIFDECETLTEKAQQSLRRPLEDYAHLVSCIFTYNDTSKIIKPLKDRCMELNFDFDLKDKKIHNQIENRLSSVCDKEGLNINNNDLKIIIKGCGLSYRKMLETIEFHYEGRDYKNEFR